MKTAVEWLFDAVYKDMSYPELLGLIAQAKEMEKEQIMKAFNEGTFATDEKITAEEYLKGFKDGKEYQIKLDELLHLDNEFEMKLIDKNEYQARRKQVIKQAKEMEKEQIMDAYNEGDNNGADRIYYHSNRDDKSSEQYYNETFKQETLTYTETAKKEERIFNSTMMSKQKTFKSE